MGFLPPWSVFVGNLAAPERSYLTTLLAGLKGRYPRLIEPAAGSFAVATIARELGWDSASIETSDVSLYSSALGEAICGRDLASLAFLPAQFDDFKALVDVLDGSQQLMGLAPLPEYAAFAAALGRFARLKEIRNMSTAVAVLTRTALEQIAEHEKMVEDAESH